MSASRSPYLADIGSLTSTIDYQEAANNSHLGAVYMGSLQDIGYMGQDIEQNKQSSCHYGRVFCPERPDRPDYGPINNWSYEKNMAFFAGVIASKRPVVLMTDIDLYGHRKTGATTHELLWLNDNGYTFKPDPSNPKQTLAIPPNQTSSHPMMFHYQDQDRREFDLRSMLNRIRAIKDDVLKQRQTIQSSVASVSSPPPSISSASTASNKYVPPSLRTAAINKTSLTSIPASPTQSVTNQKYIPPSKRKQQPSPTTSSSTTTIIGSGMIPSATPVATPTSKAALLSSPISQAEPKNTSDEANQLDSTSPRPQSPKGP